MLFIILSMSVHMYYNTLHKILSHSGGLSAHLNFLGIIIRKLYSNEFFSNQLKHVNLSAIPIHVIVCTQMYLKTLFMFAYIS